MTVSSLNRSVYPCTCRKFESTTVERTDHGAAQLITHPHHGTHDPRQPHGGSTATPVRAWATDTWPRRA